MLHSQNWEINSRLHILFIENFIVVLDLGLTFSRCNILISPHFPVHVVSILEGNTHLCMRLYCVVHHHVLENPGDIQEMGKFSHLHVWDGGILQRGSENVTPVSVNVNEPFKLK